MTSRSSLDFIPRRRSLPDQVSQISHDSFQVHRSDSNSTAGHWRSLSNRSSLIGLNWLQDQAETKSRLCEEMELKLLFASGKLRGHFQTIFKNCVIMTLTSIKTIAD